MTLVYPPGPRAGTLALVKSIMKGEKFEPLSFARLINEQFGGMSYVQFGPIHFYQVSDADIAHEVLVEKADQFHKAKMVKESFRPFIGNGLLISEGDFWKRQRKLTQPAFHSKRIEAYAIVMVEHTQKMLDGWRDGETRFIDREMMKLTLGIVCKTLFDADVSSDAEHVGELMTEVLDASNKRLFAAVRLPDWVKTPKRSRLRQHIVELDAIIQRFVSERRASGEDRGDLLSMLLMAVDEGDDSQMTDKQLRDEAMTLFIAGHETTAMALSWTWYLLAQNPEWMTKLQAEVDIALQGRSPTLRDLANLPLGEMVLKEAMRLYPPAISVGREPIADMEVGGYAVKQGDMVQVSIYGLHYQEKYFPKPDVFDPTRFTAENEKQIPRYAYLPFGAGPRVCIGNQFAMMEARLILATMLQHFDLNLMQGQTVIPEVLLTLRPKNGIQMKVKAREPVMMETVG
jgi:cytochrome P450